MLGDDLQLVKGGGSHMKQVVRRQRTTTQTVEHQRGHGQTLVGGGQRGGCVGRARLNIAFDAQLGLDLPHLLGQMLQTGHHISGADRPCRHLPSRSRRQPELHLQPPDLVERLQRLGVNMHRGAIRLTFDIRVVVANAERFAKDADFRNQTFGDLNYPAGRQPVGTTPSGQRGCRCEGSEQDANSLSICFEARNGQSPYSMHSMRSTPAAARHPHE